MTLCDWIIWTAERGRLACVAEALPGDRYCSAHRAQADGITPRPSITRKDREPYHDADLLPLSPEEFQRLAELARRTRR